MKTSFKLLNIKRSFSRRLRGSRKTWHFMTIPFDGHFVSLSALGKEWS